MEHSLALLKASLCIDHPLSPSQLCIIVFAPQSWYDNMGRTSESQINGFEGEEFTCITFKPDLAKFKMSTLDKDTVALMTRRAYDIAGASKGIRVILNGKKLPVSLPPNMILLIFSVEILFLAFSKYCL